MTLLTRLGTILSILEPDSGSQLRATRHTVLLRSNIFNFWQFVRNPQPLAGLSILLSNLSIS